MFSCRKVIVPIHLNSAPKPFAWFGQAANRWPSSPGELDVTSENLRIWTKQQADIDEGNRHDGATTDEAEEVRRLPREIKTLREEREILVKAAAFFAKATGTQVCGGVPGR